MLQEPRELWTCRLFSGHILTPVSPQTLPDSVFCAEHMPLYIWEPLPRAWRHQAGTQGQRQQ